MADWGELKSWKRSELENDLKRRNNDTLQRFFEYTTGETTNRPPHQIVATLLNNHREEVEEFYESLAEIKTENLNRRDAEEYLNHELGVGGSDLNTSNRFELLLVIHEEELQDNLQEIIHRSKLYVRKSERQYILDIELPLDDLEPRAKRKFGRLNREVDNLDPVSVTATVDDDDSRAYVGLFSEYGRRFIRYFEFREDEKRQATPPDPSMTHGSIYPLKTLGIELVVQDEQTAITFTENPRDGWTRTVRYFFRTVFGVSNVFQILNEQQSPTIVEIQKSARRAIQEGDDAVETMREVIAEKKESALDDLEEQEMPEEEKEAVETSISETDLVGYVITKDPNTSTNEFTIVASDLDELFKSVEGMRDTVDDYLRKAGSERVKQIVKVGDNHVVLDSGNYRPHYGSNLKSESEKAAKILFHDK